MSEWQPIETAPRDGTVFQGWVTTGAGGCWASHCRMNSDGMVEVYGRVDYDMDGWDIWPQGATHWMPLPSPPHAPSGQEGA